MLSKFCYRLHIFYDFCQSPSRLVDAVAAAAAGEGAAPLLS